MSTLLDNPAFFHNYRQSLGLQRDRAPGRVSAYLLEVRLLKSIRRGFEVMPFVSAAQALNVSLYSLDRLLEEQIFFYKVPELKAAQAIYDRDGLLPTLEFLLHNRP